MAEQPAPRNPPAKVPRPPARVTDPNKRRLAWDRLSPLATLQVAGHPERQAPQSKSHHTVAQSYPPQGGHLEKTPVPGQGGPQGRGAGVAGDSGRTSLRR